MITFVGDIMLGRKVDPSKKTFKNVKKFFKNITFANLESPISNNPHYLEKKYHFSIKEEAIKLLEDFDIFSIANNHITDCKEEGVLNTISVLEKNNFLYTGLSNKPTIIERNKIKIGFLAYCQDNKSFKYSKTHPLIISKEIVSHIKKAKKSVDFLIVSLHWGMEYKKEPSKYQINFAKELIDNGADIIIGHHPHVVQKIEKYKKGLIAYSLGNFVFDQKFSKRVRKGIILQVDLNNIQDYKTINTYINDNFEVEIQ